MLLQKLEADADAIVSQTPPMYDFKPVKWVIELTEEGEPLGPPILTTGSGDSQGGQDRGKRLLVPHVKRTSGIRPILLADTPAYTFGVSEDDSRAEQKHEAYLKLLAECARETGCGGVAAVLRFLTNADSYEVPDDMGSSDLITFRVAGKYPTDEPLVREFWSHYTLKSTEHSDELSGACAVCGKITVIPPKTPVPIKRVPGGQKSGVALVSANLSAFESFGLKRASTCGVCQQCGERIGKALNHLLEDDSRHFNAGPVVFVFWTSEQVEFDILQLIRSPNPQDVKLLLSSYYSGRHTFLTDEDAAQFNVAALSAAGGRLVVRDFDGSTIGAAKHNLARWFALTNQVDAWGAQGRSLGLYQLAAAPFRDPEKEMPPNVPITLMKSALFGSRPLPHWLSVLTISRCKASSKSSRNRQSERITYAQAALLKAVLVSSLRKGEEYMSVLDKSEDSPAYLCGRLLAVLEQVQYQAIPGVTTTVVDKFFASASTAPASVFGKLLSDAQPHLSKLRKTRTNAYVALERKIEEILAPLERFPMTLSMQEQALFSLGFYHQRAADRAARKAAAAPAGAATSNKPDMED